MSLLASSLLFPLLCCKINLPPCLLYACHCSFLTRCNRLESLTWSCNATDHYEVSSKPRLTLYLSFVFCASKACCIRNFCKKRILSRFFLTGILIWTSVLTFHYCRGWSNVFVFCISLYTYFFFKSLAFFFFLIVSVFGHHFVQVWMAISRGYFWREQSCQHFYKGTWGLLGIIRRLLLAMCTDMWRFTATTLWWFLLCAFLHFTSTLFRFLVFY